MDGYVLEFCAHCAQNAESSCRRRPSSKEAAFALSSDNGKMGADVNSAESGEKQIMKQPLRYLC